MRTHVSYQRTAEEAQTLASREGNSPTAIWTCDGIHSRVTAVMDKLSISEKGSKRVQPQVVVRWARADAHVNVRLLC